MKKFLIALCLLLSFTGIASAQTAPKKQTRKVEAPAPKKETSAAVPLKADGTPDKRYKVNKQAAAEGPLKKDGTPDKRFKANKKS